MTRQSKFKNKKKKTEKKVKYLGQRAFKNFSFQKFKLFLQEQSFYRKEMFQNFRLTFAKFKEFLRPSGNKNPSLTTLYIYMHI